MTEDERIDEKSAAAEEANDVEAHGAKHVVAAGLAGAALIGAGAAGVKLATDDDKPNQRVEGALTSSEEVAPADLKAADRDGDGYLTYRELTDGGFDKWNVDELNAEGYDVTGEGLAAAGGKFPIEAVGREGGFAIKENTIFLRLGVEPELDEMVKGSALDWSSKLREIDRDGDGYAGVEELDQAGVKMNVAPLNEAGYDVTPEDLEKAMAKIELASLGEGGFVMQEDMVMLRLGVDDKFDELLDKWRG